MESDDKFFLAVLLGLLGFASIVVISAAAICVLG